MLVRNKEKFFEGLRKGKYTLRSAHPDLRKDRDVLIECARFDRKSNILKIGLKNGFKDIDFISEILKYRPKEFRFLSKAQKTDEEFLLSLFGRGCEFLELVPKDIRENEEFVRRAVSINGLLIKNVSEEMLQDRELCYLAIKNNPIAYKFLRNNFRNDPNLACLAVSRKPEMFFWLTDELTYNPKVVKACFKANSDFTYSVYKDKLPEEIKQNVGVSVAACNSNLRCLLEVPTDTYLSEGFKTEFDEIIGKKEEAILKTSNNPEEELGQLKREVKELLTEKEALVVEERGEEYVYQIRHLVQEETSKEEQTDTRTDNE